MPNPYAYREYEYYCPKCGQCNFVTFKSDCLCKVCKSKMIETPPEYGLTEQNWLQLSSDEFNQIKQRLFDEVISKSPEFDAELYNRKDSILEEEDRLMEEALAPWKASLERGEEQVKCTYCQSTNVKKIGFLSRAVSAELFGLGSGKIGKQWHCKNCGSDF